MGFKKLLASMGAGGASVETVLSEPNVVPGGVVQGEITDPGRLGRPADRGTVSVGLQARVEVETDDGEYKQNVEFHRQQLGGAFEVQPGAVHAVQFGMEIPWETPITMFMGQQLTGMNVGVTTELQIARAIDSGDLDPVNVHPLPAQQAMLDAFGALGFRFKTRRPGARPHPRHPAAAALLPGDRVLRAASSTGV